MNEEEDREWSKYYGNPLMQQAIYYKALRREIGELVKDERKAREIYLYMYNTAECDVEKIVKEFHYENQ